MELFLNSYVNVLINFTFSYQLTHINSCGRIKLASLVKPHSSQTPLSPERGGAQLFAFGFTGYLANRGTGFQGDLCTGLFTVWRNQRRSRTRRPGVDLHGLHSQATLSFTHGTAPR